MASPASPGRAPPRGATDKDKAKAMADYRAREQSVREKSARLKTLRLAKEAEDDKASAAPKGAAGTRAAAKTKTKPAAKAKTKGAPKKPAARSRKKSAP